MDAGLLGFAITTLPIAIALAGGAPAWGQGSLGPQSPPPASDSEIPHSSGDPRFARSHGVFLDLPIVDAPFVFAGGGAFPSMEQSLATATTFYEALHFGLGAWLDPPRGSGRERWPVLHKLLVATADVFAATLPFALAWQHEEWHRAVLSRYGMGSYDDVYKLNIFADVISVSRVRDEDLVRLKADHPADQVRLSAAGIEGNTQLAVNLERVVFFHDTRTWNTVLLWLLAVQNTSYMYQCMSPSSDTLTQRLERDEGTSIANRDFTGLDCDGWTYDLFRPDEPYAARGIHPSGVGYRRYRSYSLLTADEQRYLRQQTALSLLNFVDPNLLGFRRFVVSPAGGEPVAFNLALRHLPTSFGYDVRADALAQRGGVNLALSLHGYFNREHVFPGIEAELLRYAVPGAGNRVLVSSRVALWLQPRAQRFDATDAQPGGLVSLRATLRLWDALQPFVEGEGKSAGWVTGNVYLDRHLSMRAGLSAGLF